METIVFDAELLHELDAGINLRLCVLHRARLGVECLVSRPCAEHIDTRRAEVVPPCHRKAQMLFHRFSKNYALCIIILECQLVLAVSALERNLRDVWKNLAHDPAPFLLRYNPLPHIAAYDDMIVWKRRFFLHKSVKKND